MLEMAVDSIRVSLMNYQRVVILKEKQTDRYLPIWIGPSEADAIAVKLQDVEVPRPLTHDLIGTIIDCLGGEVDRIIVTDLQNDTFFAKIVVNVNGDSKEIDARPSDAIAVAVRTKVPIFVEETVLDLAGILIDHETGNPLINPGTDETGAGSIPVGEIDIQKMSAFKDFIEGLNFEDFEKPGEKTGTEGDKPPPN